MVTAMADERAGVSHLGLKRLEQRWLRLEVQLLDAEEPGELGQAFELTGEGEVTIDRILQRRECVLELGRKAVRTFVEFGVLLVLTTPPGTKKTNGTSCRVSHGPASAR